ncbi:hypothetical protein M9H77_36587 [Catharanthus roseus]|uniref:Uncharacterized protein n=1 Tax=Catharanthus roseus TaxID=4058 RepID=A0ACB9ZWI6_CATRO|nr:hypothetical protein M9H77_36587 [Catharanthus roseus]
MKKVGRNGWVGEMMEAGLHPQSLCLQPPVVFQQRHYGGVYLGLKVLGAVLLTDYEPSSSVNAIISGGWDLMCSTISASTCPLVPHAFPCLQLEPQYYFGYVPHILFGPCENCLGSRFPWSDQIDLDLRKCKPLESLQGLPHHRPCLFLGYLGPGLVFRPTTKPSDFFFGLSLGKGLGSMAAWKIAFNLWTSYLFK